MKLFVIGSAIPCGEQDMQAVTAVNVVQHELLSALAQLGHTITFQLLFNPHRVANPLTREEERALAALSAKGIVALPPIFPDDYIKSAPKGVRQLALRAWRLVGGTRFGLLYPSVRVAPIVKERVGQARSDAVLTLWSPEGLGATHGLGVPRIAYHGDIDFQTEQVRQRDRYLFGVSPETSGFASAIGSQLRRHMAARESNRAHWRLMQPVSVIANVTALNADHYRALGHRRSVYVRNTWPDPGPIEGRGLSSRRASGPIKIIGHIGYLNRTGSTYGLRLLLEEIVPSLDELMDGLDYRVEIIGGGEVVPALRPLLNQKHVVVRGFVPDLAADLDSSDVILMCNNAGPYQAAFTRHLVAWSRGLCLIVHEKSRLAIPEIAPGSNVLAGSTGAEIARQIQRAVTDQTLNRHIREGGRATYEKYFTPAHVAAKLNRELQAAR